MKRIWTLAIVLALCVLPIMANGQEETTTQEQEGASEFVIAQDAQLPISGIGKTVSTNLKAKGDYTLACIVKNSTNPYMVSQLEGFAKAGEDMGFEAITMAPSQQDSVEEQVRIVEDMLQKGVDGIVIHCADSNGIMPAIRKAKAAGVEVVTIGTPAAEPTFLRTGVNYEETGYVIAKEVAQKVNGKGKVIILEGPAGAQNARERLNGIKRGLSEYPDMEIVASQTANFKRTEGMSVTENLIQKYQDVDAIIAANDESALGAIQALKAAGITDVAVAGFDGSVDAADSIGKSEMLASYNTDPYGSGYLAAAYLVEYLNDGTTPPTNFVPFPSEKDKPVIDAATIDDYVNTTAWWK
ncbi:MAG: sugar ABC transporter substrate-binding protein [Pleomorphochaeta sp.]|jgi:ABC-type sugar transport system substrate-binding protein